MAESVLRNEWKKYCRQLKREFWRLLPQDAHLFRRTNKFFDKAPISTAKMWKCRVDVAEKLGVDKRNAIGTNFNSHLQFPSNNEEASEKKNKKKEKKSIRPLVCMKHSGNASATYKPKECTRSTIGANEATRKRKKCTRPSVYMKHSVIASVTYKPKQCIGPTKRIIVQAIFNE